MVSRRTHSTNVRPSSLFFVPALLLAVLLSAGCGALSKATRAESRESRDSVRVEIHTVHLETVDTVYVTLPPERITETTLDTLSVLETTVARSEASVSGGHLSHTLETRYEAPLPVQVKTIVERRDSVIYRDREVAVEKVMTVPREKSRWEKIQTKGFWALLAALALYLCYKLQIFSKL